MNAVNPSSGQSLEYAAFDADNHYYEALDAFTRHVPEKMRARCVQWATIDGRQHHIDEVDSREILEVIAQQMGFGIHPLKTKTKKTK